MHGQNSTVGMCFNMNYISLSKLYTKWNIDVPNLADMCNSLGIPDFLYVDKIKMFMNLFGFYCKKQTKPIDQKM